MKCFLIYDIPDDKLRTKIADFCLDYGLERIQLSAFVGELMRNHQEELFLKITNKLKNSPGNVQLFPICNKDWHKRLSFEKTKN